MPDDRTTRKIRERLRELVGPAKSGGEAQLADLLGTSAVNVNRWITGERGIPHDTLARIADEYEVTLDWLYGRDVRARDDQPTSEPAWARRLRAQQKHLERLIAQKEAAPPDVAERLDQIMTRDEVQDLVQVVKAEVMSAVEGNHKILRDATEVMRLLANLPSLLDDYRIALERTQQQLDAESQEPSETKDPGTPVSQGQ